MAKITKQLLENLIRLCANQVIDIIQEADTTIGAPAPPSDGLGTADQPPIPKQPSKMPPSVPTKQSKGIVLVNPRNPSKLKSYNLKYSDNLNLEKDLHKIGASIAGEKVKVSLNAVKFAKEAIVNPSSPVYLYIGKFDPSETETFVMADKDLTRAKENSLSPSDIGFIPTSTEPLSLYPSKENKPSQNLFELKDEIRKIVKGALSEELGSLYSNNNPSSQNGLKSNADGMMSSTDNNLTADDLKKQEIEKEKERRDSLKAAEERLKVAKKRSDFQKQELDQTKRFEIPQITQTVQNLKR